MNKYIQYIVAALILAATSSLQAWSETRTPLSLYRGPISFQNYFDWRRDITGEKTVFGDYWMGLYRRYAPDAFGDSSCGCQNNVPCFDNREPLSTLYFGKPCFQLAQAFANGNAGQIGTINPWVAISTICPRFTYSENGAWFGGQVMFRWGCDESWCAGARIRAPYRQIDVEEKCSDWGENSNTPTDLAQVYSTRSEAIQVGSSQEESNIVFAARLDFVSTLLSFAYNVDGTSTPFVTYPTTGDITFAGQQGSGNVPAVGPVSPVSPFLALIESTDSSMPSSVRWGDTPSNSNIVVQADGSGLNNLQRGRIAKDIVYTPLGASTAEQKQLFLVPNVQDTGGTAPGQLVPFALSVASSLSSAVASIQPSVLTFFAQTGLDFCNGRTQGLGDTDFELYLGKMFGSCAWLEGRIGVVAPTGVTVKNPLQVLKQPTGNNGHTELRIGMGAGMQHCRYMRFDFNLAYSWVLKASQIYAAPFVGATVANIGPCVAGTSSWQHFEANFNWTFLNPACDCMGVLIGYQAYVKDADKVCLNVTKAYDFNGVLQSLNPELLSQGTYRLSNKIKTEAFFNAECGDFYVGFTSVVSGKNIAHETDMHIGINVRF